MHPLFSLSVLEVAVGPPGSFLIFFSFIFMFVSFCSICSRFLWLYHPILHWNFHLVYYIFYFCELFLAIWLYPFPQVWFVLMDAVAFLSSWGIWILIASMFWVFFPATFITFHWATFLYSIFVFVSLSFILEVFSILVILGFCSYCRGKN